ncbi:MAG TPA: c-type cytochrome [Pyrinomonadaceae bacterium]
MAHKALKHFAASVLFGLAFIFFIANWTITRTTAVTGNQDGKSAAAQTLWQLPPGHPLVSEIPLVFSNSTPENLSGVAGVEQGLRRAFGPYSFAAHSPARTGPQAVQGDKPVEQTRKNIQVLKGLPESQLFPVMNFIRTSLGVSCAFCHVNAGGDKWEWEKDDKPEKVTARKMMLMQFDINKGNRDLLGSSNAVTCYTCHRGQTHPLRAPLLPQPAPAGGPAGETPKAAETTPPTVDQIFERYVQALGGKAAYEKVKTRVWKGSHIISDGTALPLETSQAAPGKLVSIVTTKNGPVISGFNGTVGWTKNARGQREVQGAQLEQMKRAADFYGDLHLKELYPNARFAGRDKIGEREVYVVVSQVSESRRERLYFDKETGLLLRILANTQTMLGPLPEQTDFSDYREVDGIKLPFTIQQSFIDPWTGWTRKFTEIKQNVPVDDAKFNPPAASK